MPARFTVAKGEVVLCGVVISIDEQTGTASSIRRLQVPYRG
jgi:calcineurin-like phosphoesterase